MTLTGRLSEKFWEVETDLKWESLTRTSNQGKPLRVVEADVEGDLALGGGDHVRVGQAHFKLQVVLCIVAKTIPEKVLFLEKLFTPLMSSPGVLTPCPICRIFNRLFWKLRPLGHFKAGSGSGGRQIPEDAGCWQGCGEGDQGAGQETRLEIGIYIKGLKETRDLLWRIA